MIMNFTPEQIASTNKAGIEALLGLAHTQFSAFERLSALYFNATKAAFEEGVGHAKALLNAKDPQEYLNLNAAATQPTMEKAMAYSRSVYEVAAQTNGELAKFLEAQAVEFNKNLVGLLDKVSKNAPAGSDVAVAAVKSALAAANTAYESFNKVAKQATEFDVTARARLAHAGQAEGLQAAVALLQFDHQRRDDRFGKVIDDDRGLGFRRAVKQMRIALVEHPLDHGPGHHRESRDEMVVFQGKPGDAVVRIGNDARATRKFAHFEPLRRDFHVGARADRRLSVGV